LERRRKLVRLKREATGREFDAALDAMTRLLAMGEDSRDDVDRALSLWQSRQLRQMQSAARYASPSSTAARYEKELAALRAEAWENIRKLSKGESVARARAHYKQLAVLYKRLQPLYEKQIEAVAAIAEHDKLVAFWQQHRPASAAQIDAEGFGELEAKITEGLGLSRQQIGACYEFNNGKPPSDEAARTLWFYIACARIDAFNAGHAHGMSRSELANAEAVNAYRKLLGVLPYEYDARLVQSARRHSKEMVELNYFAHDSPTEANRSHVKRMNNAGYHKGAYSENIAYGSASGERTFWQWFDSPGHHKNMVRREATCLGVGNWARHWTQNMGRGSRLMTQSAEQRELAVIEGEVLRSYR